jgi:pSer/pThr/pTyr-binding forkhead associated (FHA) protein
MDVKLHVVGGKQAGMQIPVPGPKFLIGRANECQIRPNNALVSRRHCAILIEEGAAVIEDLGSSNGTFVNDERIQRQPLKNGDRLKIGVLEFEVHLSVDVGGKKMPKVRSVQEAAARTVAAAPGKGDELDISGWLEEDDPTSAKPARTPNTHDTVAGKSLDDTVHIPAAPAQTPASAHGDPAKKHEKDAHPKATGRFHAPPKPKAENSGSAADELLKQFFKKKA